MTDRKAAAAAINDFLRAIGRDPQTEPELRGTGARVADAYLDDLCVGYTQDPKALLDEEAIAETTHLVVARSLPIST
ncbi:MAG: GTP cyclohydrolase I, partial [Polyangiaceae bacterium]